MIANPDLSCPFPPWTNIIVLSAKSKRNSFFCVRWILNGFHKPHLHCRFLALWMLLELCFPASHNSIDGWNKWTMTKTHQRHGLSVYHPLFLEFHTSFLGMMHTKSVFISSIDSQDHQISRTHDGSMGLVNSPHIFSLIWFELYGKW